jgi:hypothetical protein
METSTAQVGSFKTPAWLIFLAETLIPPFARDFISGDLREKHYPSFRSCAWRWAVTAYGTIRDQAKWSFSSLLPAAEALFLSLPLVLLERPAPLLPLAMLLLLLLPLLRLRDAYAYPADGSEAEMVKDLTCILILIAAIEAGLRLWAFRFALPGHSLPLTVAGAVAMAFFRMVYRREDPPDPVWRDLREMHIATWHMNLLLAAASVPLSLSNIQAIPGTHLRDKLLAIVPSAMMAIAWTQKKKHWTGVTNRKPQTLFSDPGLNDLKHQRAILPVWDRGSESRTDLVPEVLYFVTLGFPLEQAAWWWASGSASAATVDWPVAILNFGALLALAVMWIVVKGVNRRFADRLDAAIAAQEAEPA